MISSRDFYSPFHGHDPAHMQILVDHMRQKQRQVVWLAGDSSLDNKYWFRDQADATNGLEEVLQPPRCKQDIAYWINKLIADQEGEGYENLKPFVAVNGAVEESTVGRRACGRMLSQDTVIRDNIQPEDYLVVSVGGNDIALAPNCCTALNMVTLLRCTPTACIKGGFGVALPCEECCCGCGFSCLNSLFGCPPSVGYFIHLFKTRVESYVKNLTGIHRPRKIVVCMIYYPDEVADGSWADGTLSALGYNNNPAKLQLVIRKIFALATQHISIPGSEVIAVPLFLSLDGKDSSQYVQRVEPSVKGGKEMARLLVDAMASDAGKVKMEARSQLHQQEMDRVL